MKTVETAGYPQEIKAELREALANLGGGIRDPAAAKRACERMDQMRERNRAIHGEQEIAVGIIREMRDRE